MRGRSIEGSTTWRSISRANSWVILAGNVVMRSLCLTTSAAAENETTRRTILLFGIVLVMTRSAER